jgi:hypothetical protein
MIHDLHDRRGRLVLLLGIRAAILALSGRSSWADIGGRGFVVAVSAADATRAANGLVDIREKACNKW